VLCGFLRKPLDKLADALPDYPLLYYRMLLADPLNHIQLFSITAWLVPTRNKIFSTQAQRIQPPNAKRLGLND
jgi:hypothetical protein